MKCVVAFALLISLSLAVLAAPSGSTEKTEHGNKDIIMEIEEKASSGSTQSPDFEAEGSENWAQSKYDAQSLFLNKSDKNDLEPYPMALSDDVYDGQPIKAGEEIPRRVAESDRGKLEHLIMRPEFYGEPPSMTREGVRRKRAGRLSLRSSPEEKAFERVNKMGSRYNAINRSKRNVQGIPSEDILALLSLWEEQQRRNNENLYNEDDDSIYNNLGPYYDDDKDADEERWYNEPIIPSTHFSRQNYQTKPIYNNRYEHKIPESSYPYMQNVDGYRKKRQWSGNGNRISKRFMVAKKRSEYNPYFFTSQSSYKPYEDLYTLNELLKSQHRNPGYNVNRRMVL